jgi:DNA-binding transcriptional ArsR family regulator
MSIDRQFPDYELADRTEVSTPGELRAMGDSLRITILDLLLERAATVGEMASAVGRPRGTVAHHVKVLIDAGMLRVVRTRRVRAIDERFYGRTARTFYVGAIREPPKRGSLSGVNGLTRAAAESLPAHDDDDLRTIVRHARIPAERAAEFWERVDAITLEFTQIPRSGHTVYGFVAGLYPTEHPSLPESDAIGPALQ